MFAGVSKSGLLVKLRSQSEIVVTWLVAPS